LDVKTSVKAFLVDLTTRRAAYLFIGALVLGILAIVFRFGLPWTPALIVAAYGIVLFYAEKVYMLTHSEMTNNSPYFLGFLFFLVALANTFFSYSAQTGDAQLPYLIQQLGSALFPTVVGLPFRQLLFAFSPAQADHDLFFRTLEGELRQSATEFRRSQAELVQLVKEFIEMRRGLFSEEEKAARKYVRNLEKAISLFDESLSNYPAIISSTLSNCSQSLHGLKEKLRELTQAAEHIPPQQFADILAQFDSVKTGACGLASELASLKSTAEQLQALAGSAPASLNAQLISANLAFDEIGKDLRNKTANIQADLTAIDRVLTDFVTVAQTRIEAIR
jgi:hypothetical protein